MRVLGIDYGAKRIGLALGDTDSRIASPWGVVPNDGGDVVAKIGEIVKKEGVEAIVIGMPRPLRDASLENAQVKEVRVFIDALKALGVDVIEADERLSSKLAAIQEQEGRALTAAGRQKQSGQKRDDLAAAAILQSWLEGETQSH